ncbi:hypothetical protein [Streptomyces canus]|uniref:hypothetical protein n=1 Tax=Streptomyces canus TaxID=58343 RepID=UPI000AA3038B|nr:hypothetical protein [Streptomyces canus]
MHSTVQASSALPTLRQRPWSAPNRDGTPSRGMSSIGRAANVPQTMPLTSGMPLPHASGAVTIPWLG